MTKYLGKIRNLYYGYFHEKTFTKDGYQERRCRVLKRSELGLSVKHVILDRNDPISGRTLIYTH